MKQYLITAYDYTNKGAMKRRVDLRPHHLDGMRNLKRNGNYIIGGAMLNDEGQIIGSVMILQFETEEELEAWKQSDPYITQKIWETLDVKPYRVAEV